MMGARPKKRGKRSSGETEKGAEKRARVSKQVANKSPAGASTNQPLDPPSGDLADKIPEDNTTQSQDAPASTGTSAGVVAEASDEVIEVHPVRATTERMSPEEPSSQPVVPELPQGHPEVRRTRDVEVPRSNTIARSPRSERSSPSGGSTSLVKRDSRRVSDRACREDRTWRPNWDVREKASGLRPAVARQLVEGICLPADRALFHDKSTDELFSQAEQSNIRYANWISELRRRDAKIYAENVRLGLERDTAREELRRMTETLSTAQEARRTYSEENSNLRVVRDQLALDKKRLEDIVQVLEAEKAGLEADRVSEKDRADRLEDKLRLETSRADVEAKRANSLAARLAELEASTLGLKNEVASFEGRLEEARRIAVDEFKKSQDLENFVQQAPEMKSLRYRMGGKNYYDGARSFYLYATEKLGVVADFSKYPLPVHMSWEEKEKFDEDNGEDEDEDGEEDTRVELTRGEEILGAESPVRDASPIIALYPDDAPPPMSIPAASISGEKTQQVDP